MVSRQQEDKKIEERKFLECVRAKYKDFPGGLISDRDPPDFIVEAEGGAIGVEITRYPYTHLNDIARKARRQEGEWEKAVQNACSAYVSRNRFPIDVGVIFNPHFDITRARRRVLESALLELVIKNMPKMGATVSLRQDCRGCPLVPQEVLSVRIARFEVMTRSHWAVLSGGWVKPFLPSELLQMILEKEKNLVQYRDRVTQAWLVCVIDGLRPSSFVEIPHSIINQLYPTKFDKTLLLEYFDRRVLELNTITING